MNWNILVVREKKYVVITGEGNMKHGPTLAGVFKIFAKWFVWLKNFDILEAVVLF